MSFIKISHYFKVLQAYLGAVENTHLIKLNLLLLRMHIHRKKATQYFKYLKNYLKALYSNVKVLLKHYLEYCNCTVMQLFITRQKQREMTGQTQNKHFTEPPYYTHVQQNKQVLIVAADAILIQTLTRIPSPFPLIFRENSYVFSYIRSCHVFNYSPETRLTCKS